MAANYTKKTPPPRPPPPSAALLSEAANRTNQSAALNKQPPAPNVFETTIPASQRSARPLRKTRSVASASLQPRRLPIPPTKPPQPKQNIRSSSESGTSTARQRVQNRRIQHANTMVPISEDSSAASSPTTAASSRASAAFSDSSSAPSPTKQHRISQDWSPVPLHHSLVKHDRVWESSHDQWSAHLSDHDRVTRWSRSTSNATRGSKQTDTHNIKLAHEDGSKTHVRIVLINGRRHSTEWRRDEPVLSTAEQLEEYADIYGPGMVAFCKARIGQRVGNGECWTLARDAVDSVGAREVLGRNYGQMVQRFLAKPGDVLEFKQCRFEWTEGRSTHWMEAGHPNHTAIIYRVEGGGNVFHVYEQNVNGKKHVMQGTYHADRLVSGALEVWRPVALVE
eukprot:TRINITY_DN5048_c0_g1_i2.p1 TRINITY_DN5048_c0_g1~~TRINITY_DN5048_c0_g1_i2.p1  ORF type:complete len:395 (+),score=34.85 TRINITY_DN5048_c0_g1_i2:66-1250(+)